MTDPAKPVRKPWRLWILQAIVTVQVLLGIVRGLRAVKTVAPHLPELPAVLWLLQLLFALGVGIVLVLALERVFRRSDWVAQAAGFLWWAFGLYTAIAALGESPPPDLKRFMFEDVDTPSEIAGLVVVHGLLLWLAGSLLWHRPSRAYLQLSRRQELIHPSDRPVG